MLHQEQQRNYLAISSSTRIVQAAYEEAALKSRSTVEGRAIYGASDDTATLMQLKRLQNDIKALLPQVISHPCSKFRHCFSHSAFFCYQFS